MYHQPHAYHQPQMTRSLSQKKRDQAEARKAFNNEWQSGLVNAPCKDPGYCCFAFWCAYCAAYGQRKAQMRDAWPSQYTCCNGSTCVSGRCGERSNPELCLCLEVVCCFPTSVATTRFMVQDEQRVMNTQCDNCLIGFMLLTQQIALCLRCAAMISGNSDIERLADVVDCLADLTYASVCACMLTQQKIQIQYRDKQLNRAAPPGVMQAPTAPQMVPGKRSGPAPIVVVNVPPPYQQPRAPMTAPPQRPVPPSAPRGSAKPDNYYPTV